MNSANIVPPNFKHAIRASQFESLSKQLHPHIKVLSLDCFDTLIWRKSATPQDVFFALQEHPAFKQLGITAQFRGSAESRFKQLNALKSLPQEACLADIYREHNPHYTEEEINRLIDAEIETEITYSFAFAPILNLIRLAHQQNIKIIIVSDTYYLKSQLQMIFKNLLPNDTYSMINELFCSVEYGKSKVNGLFAEVIKSCNVNTHEILHIGDNYIADYISATKLNIHALHFVQQDECINDLLNLHATVANIFNPETRTTQPLMSPFRALFSCQNMNQSTPETVIGYASLGPIMYSFAHYLKNEIESLKKSYPNLKILFLMRDGYLPFLTCQQLFNNNPGYMIRISRFSVTAASFKNDDDINRYLITLGKSNRFHDIGRQLLLPPKVLEPIIKVALRNSDPWFAFIREIIKSEVTRIIINKSEKYRNRLFTYLKKETGMETGDTLLLVDLGYNGTVQRILTRLLSEKNIQIIGRYLISLPSPDSQSDQKGLIDSSWCDTKSLYALVTYIAGLEQLCTANESSVIDYDESGHTIHSDVALSTKQHQQLTRIQSEVIRFISDACSFFETMPTPISSNQLRSTTAAEIARMLFMPTSTELHYLKDFNFDFNLGTDDVLKLFDTEQGLTGLRRRGLFFMENVTRSKRTNYPAELRAASFELALTYLVQNRFSFAITPKEIMARQQLITVILQHDNERDKIQLEATMTYDGYYSLCAPVGTGVHFLLGKHFQFIEIDSAELIHRDHFIQQQETSHNTDVLSIMQLNSIKNSAGQLYECTSQDAMLSYLPNANSNTREHILRLVFRPIVKQSRTSSNYKIGHAITQFSLNTKDIITQ